MALYRDEGVVLRTMRLGEADRIVTLATPEHGKVRAVAKGVRRTKSRIGARVEPLSHVTLLCWHGRELDVITGVEVLDSFRAVRDDLDRTVTAMTMLEIVDQLAVERHPIPELFAVLVGALRTLEERPSPALLGAFCWKLLLLEGVGPSAETCARCGSHGPLVAFQDGDGGFLCRNCRRGQAVAPEVVELARLVLSGRLAAALALGIEEPDAASELERLGLLTVEHHLDRRLRTTRHLIDSLPENRTESSRDPRHRVGWAADPGE